MYFLKYCCVFFLLVFMFGCTDTGYEEIYLKNEPFGGTVPGPADPDKVIAEQAVSSYLEMLLSNPQSPDVSNQTPGYFNFYGILASGGNIEIIGCTRLMGGVYACGSIIMDNGAVIIEDIECLNKTRNRFQGADETDKMSVFKNSGEYSRPVNLLEIETRTRILRYSEIPSDENEFEAIKKI